ncbi:hypothetical protein [Streptomyces sp. NPDC002990]
MLQSSFGFNLEVVVLRTDRRLQHYWRDGAGWHEGPVIGPVAPLGPTRPTGPTGLIEPARPAGALGRVGRGGPASP